MLVSVDLQQLLFNVEIDIPLSVDVPLYFDFLSLAV